jgi:hypothetical protein
MIQATSGSLYDRALVHPDYKDFGPRVGLAYSLRPEDGGPQRIRHQLHVLQPAGKRRGGNQRSAGPVRRPQPVESHVADLPHHPEQLHHQHRQPGGLQSGQFQRGLHSAGQQMAVHSELVPLGAAATPQGHGLELSYNGNHSLRLPIIADYNQAAPEPSAPLAYTRACRYRLSGRSPGSTRPATITTTVCRPAWSTASRRACTS